MNAIAQLNSAGEIMEQVLIRGDVGALTPGERARYYIRVCQSLGLNPLTKPFEYLHLNGKLQLYALKNCTDQLRRIHGISASVVAHKEADGLFTVHVRVRTPEGREDEDFGVVSLPDTMKGDTRANAIMKAITKAKRRATLSLCGLGMLDESEVETIPEKARRSPTERPRTIAPPPKLALSPPLSEDMNDELPGDLAPPKVERSYVDMYSENPAAGMQAAE